jgi:hypothetical protein
MKRTLREYIRPMHQFVSGVTALDARKVALSFMGLPGFVRSAYRYQAQARGGPFELRIQNLYPITADRYLRAGNASGHYFHQDLWAARKIFARRPSRHLDVGSRIDGFVAHLLVFMDVEVVDVRPLGSDVKGLRFVRDNGEDLTAYESESLESISSLHALEHFGLGRYGDPIDPRACFRAMASLARLLRPGGRLYVGVPIGQERVEFNAHRVFAPDTVIAGFGGLQLVSFSAVDDEGNLRENARPEDFSRARFACGLFELTKAPSP